MPLTRRTILSAAVLPVLAPRPSWASLGDQERSILKPPRLQSGDLVGLANPASAEFEEIPIDILRESLESLGLRVTLGAHYRSRHGYFAGRDEERAADVNALFADPEVRAIIASGGWGCSRILPRLDYEMIRGNPKILLGFSDVTALLLGIHAKTGLVTFHGPAPRHTYSAEYSKRILFGAEAVTMSNPQEPGDYLVPIEDRIRTITAGRVRGRILGGNLTVLTAIVGSGYLPDWRDAILFLEDTREEVYRVDRMLTQMRLAGILDRIAGFVFGHCTKCEPGETYGSLTLEEVLDDHVKPLGVPAWQGALIGHIKRQFTIPEGIEVEIDAELGSIRMLEPAVR